jgi:agmatine/peptidylarginine deiminase
MKISYRILIMICIVLCFSKVLQASQVSAEGLHFAWEERFTQTAPPFAPVRPIAEFEPASSVMIRYPLGIPTSLVVALAQTADVLCLVSSSSQMNSAQSSFSAAGVNLARVSYMIASTDSYWTRDYGPWFLFDGSGEYGVLDFQYNRPRPGDNLVPELYANQHELPYYGMNLKQTGGNYMTDGINTAAQTQIAYSENSNNQSNVNTLMQNYLGITNYHVVQDPNNTYIDHIDCWSKFLAPDKILIRSVPPSHPQYNAIEATANYFAQQICAWGYPYRVYRVNTPQNQPYSNSLILNHRVFVPTMGSSYDAAALQVYAQALPGYEIIGVPGSAYTPWESTDALHCRTHEIPDARMLEISHQPYFGTKDYSEEYEFLANIVAHSGAALNADSLFVAYRFNSSDWQYSLLNPTGGYGYQGFITGHAVGDTIRYYIQAADNSGRKRSQPDFAELDPHIFVVTGDAQAPVLSHNPIESIGKDEVTFVVLAEDASGIAAVTISYRIDEGPVHNQEMFYGGNDLYMYTLFPDFAEGDQYFYYSIRAEDGSGNLSWLPAENQWYEATILPVSNPGDTLVALVQSLRLYPNPLGKGQILSIDYQQDKAATAQISIYNLRGQVVYENTVSQKQGKISWDGRDKSGRFSTTGIYFLLFKTPEIERKCKLIIVH